MEIYFQELKKLHPSEISTVLKLVEETGELSREVQSFCSTGKEETLSKLLGELLDVAQTTATMAFLLDREKKTSLKRVLILHLSKLYHKGYLADSYNGGKVEIEGGRIVMELPQLKIHPNIIQTCLKINEEAGELAQIVGKYSGLSGEERNLLENDWERTEGLALALLDVAQCCVTMLYIMVEQFNVNINELLKKHENKLRSHGYL